MMWIASRLLIFFFCHIASMSIFLPATYPPPQERVYLLRTYLVTGGNLGFPVDAQTLREFLQSSHADR
ncbi:hypothetical protein Krac_7794 [Ktedonobacter racemifer DSM 44963]|uniref:Uncharacterized protein n=1 Tax=Ktedonobacter racemifer DSM 44963 TaxID=485913 RepID=D6TL45_KTERA|nr:hypothetical protein Krac_7794 [Ktedonobacter racemifer DSM 44963]